MNKSKRHLKTVNEQILNKAEYALETIKRYEARRQKEIDKNMMRIYRNPLEDMKEPTDNFSHLNYHKKLMPDQIVRVQLFPYAQDFFCIDVQQFIFPIRIILRHVRNQATVYIGYDQEFPGITKSLKNVSPSKKESEKQNNYNYKSIFQQDKMITLKKPENMPENIYMSFIAGKDLSMFALKIDYIGYDGMEQEDDFQFRRVKTDVTPETFQFQQPLNLEQQNKIQLSDKKLVTKYSQRQTKRHFFPSLNQKKKRMLSQEKLEAKKNFVLLNGVRAQSFSKEEIICEIQAKKERKKEQTLRIKINKEAQDQARQKNILLNETSQKFRKQIHAYEKIYKKQKEIKELMNRKLISILLGSIFFLKGQNIYEKRQKKMQQIWKIRYLIRKFTKKLKNKLQENKKLLPKKSQRTKMNVVLCFSLGSKVVQSNSVSKAANLIFDVFTQAIPPVIVNNAFGLSNNFRRAVRFIQRSWLSKYRARLSILMNFGYDHVKVMISEYPHLKIAEKKFMSDNICKKIIEQYMKEESMKYRHIHSAYLLRVEEIKQFIETNKRILQNSEMQNAKLLEIPQFPLEPQQRFFRNLDMLRGMIRGWFQLQYKKFVKKNIGK